MSQAVDVASAIKILTGLARNYSLRRLQETASLKDLAIAESTTEDLSAQSHGSSDGNWMSLIVVSGSALRIALSVHFSHAEGAQLTALALQRSVTDVSLVQTVDLVREYCNLTAGRLKQALEARKLHLEMSLPLLARSFGDMFFPTADGKALFSDHWKIQSRGVVLSCFLSVEVYHQETVASHLLLSGIVDQDSHGEVEFL